MKKIFLILVLSFGFCLNANALDYTPWSEWSDYKDLALEPNDLTDVQKERRFNYYKYNKILGPYGDTSLDYPYTDDEDVTYKCSDWSDDFITESDEYVTESKEFYHYKNASLVNKIVVRLNGNYSYDNIEIYYKETAIETIKDSLSTAGYIIFHLDKTYDMDEINIKLLDARSFPYESSVDVIVDGFLDDIHHTNYILSYMGMGDIVFEGIKQTPVEMDDYFTEEPLPQIVGHLKVYAGKVLKYRKCEIQKRTYNLEKEYYGTYTTNAIDDYIFKDDNDYIDYYSYRQRDYINLVTEDELQENVNTESLDKSISENIKTNIVNEKKESSFEVLGEKSLPTKNVIKPKLVSNHLNINKEENKDLSKMFLMILLLIIIIILTLSKLYKWHKKNVKV